MLSRQFFYSNFFIKWVDDEIRFVLLQQYVQGITANTKNHKFLRKAHIFRTYVWRAQNENVCFPCFYIFNFLERLRVLTKLSKICSGPVSYIVACYLINVNEEKPAKGKTHIPGSGYLVGRYCSFLYPRYMLYWYSDDSAVRYFIQLLHTESGRDPSTGPLWSWEVGGLQEGLPSGLYLFYEQLRNTWLRTVA